DRDLALIKSEVASYCPCHPERSEGETLSFASPRMTPPKRSPIMTDRRRFVSTMLAAGVGAPVLNSFAVRRVAEAAEIAGSKAPLAPSEDEAYWGAIRRAFTLDDTLVNLNNGWSSPAPAHVLEQMIRDMRFTNELPVEHMARLLE